MPCRNHAVSCPSLPNAWGWAVVSPSHTRVSTAQCASRSLNITWHAASTAPLCRSVVPPLDAGSVSCTRSPRYRTLPHVWPTSPYSPLASIVSAVWILRSDLYILVFAAVSNMSALWRIIAFTPFHSRIGTAQGPSPVYPSPSVVRILVSPSNACWWVAAPPHSHWCSSPFFATKAIKTITTRSSIILAPFWLAAVVPAGFNLHLWINLSPF